MKKLLQRTRDFTALFARQRRVRHMRALSKPAWIPDDVAVVSFDDVPLAADRRRSRA